MNGKEKSDGGEQIRKIKFFLRLNLRKKIVFVFLTLAFLFFLFYFFNRKENFKIIKIGNIEILVEIADTFEEREKGLSNRDFLPENQGMLFLFEKPDFYGFWMKDMRFPLDFIWILGDEIVEITENVKPKDYQPPNVLTSKQKVDKVLEVNAGFVEKFKIKVGDRISF